MLWRNASMETHPTSLNMSTDHFTITVNVTSLEKSLIVCVEPEGPLSLTLYLGFQHQPNHTHFRLPKERVSQKGKPQPDARSFRTHVVVVLTFYFEITKCG